MRRTLQPSPAWQYRADWTSLCFPKHERVKETVGLVLERALQVLKTWASDKRNQVRESVENVFARAAIRGQFSIGISMITRRPRFL
jgi:hypothetical protein